MIWRNRGWAFEEENIRVIKAHLVPQKQTLLRHQNSETAIMMNATESLSL